MENNLYSSDIFARLRESSVEKGGWNGKEG
jgi:hypothetical protein